MLFVREDIPNKLLSVENHPTESFYVELIYEKPNGCFVALTTQKDAKLIFTYKTWTEF